SGHKVRPARVPVPSVLPSGEKASGPDAPGNARSSVHVAVSHTRTVSRFIPGGIILPAEVARREPSADNATGPPFVGKEFSSVQSVVFHTRTVVGLADTNRAPPGKKAIETAPLGILETGCFVRMFQTLNLLSRIPCATPAASKSPPGDTARE